MRGSIKKRNDKWSFVVDVGINPKTGKRRQKTKSGFKTKKEAQESLRDFLNELDSRGYVEESNILFKKFTKQWLDLYDDGTKKPATIITRERQIRKLDYYFGKLKVKEINKIMYQAMLDDQLKQGLKRSSISVLHSTGCLIFATAFELGIIKTNPTEFAKIKRLVKTLEEFEKIELPKFMDRHELKTFLDHVKLNGIDCDYQIFTLMAYTGLRSGEALALKNADVDLENMEIRIFKTLHHPGGPPTNYKLVSPKTRKSNRSVIIGPEIVEMLKEQIQENKIQKMAQRDIWHDEDFLFPKYRINPGYPISVSGLTNRFYRLIEKSKVNKQLSPHSLRHTHTSLLAEAGVGLAEIMDRLGHANDTTTRNIYLHVTRDKKREAALLFSKHLNQA